MVTNNLMNRMIFLSVIVLVSVHLLVAHDAVQSQTDPLTQTFLIDRVVATVMVPARGNVPEMHYIICQSELDRVGFDGKKPTLRDLIIEILLHKDALDHNVPLTDLAHRHKEAVKKQHGLTDQQFDKISEDAGLTPVEGEMKLCKMAAYATMIDLKVKSRISFIQRDVEEYDEQHPKYKAAQYQLEVAFFPFISREQDKQNEQLHSLSDGLNRGNIHINWSSPVWIKESDLAADKRFITGMHEGDISSPQLVADGFEIYRLKTKKERARVPLQKRFRKIVDILRKPKFDELFEQYIQELVKNASIEILDSALKLTLPNAWV